MVGRVLQQAQLAKSFRLVGAFLAPDGHSFSDEITCIVAAHGRVLQLWGFPFSSEIWALLHRHSEFAELGFSPRPVPLDQWQQRARRQRSVLHVNPSVLGVADTPLSLF